MSHHQTTAQASATNPNMVTAVLIASFIIVAAFILPRVSLGVTPSNGDGQVEVAQAAPTAIPLPTSTLLPTAIPTATPAPQIAANAGPVSAGGVAYDPALVAQGQQLFALCAACHGPDGRGVPNLGKDLVASKFIAGLSDEEMMNFIKTGRPIWDALNTTGIDMPPKGGNPAMTDADISAIIAYVRGLQASGG